MCVYTCMGVYAAQKEQHTAEIRCPGWKPHGPPSMGLGLWHLSVDLPSGELSALQAWSPSGR